MCPESLWVFIFRFFEYLTFTGALYNFLATTNAVQFSKEVKTEMTRLSIFSSLYQQQSRHSLSFSFFFSFPLFACLPSSFSILSLRMKNLKALILFFSRIVKILSSICRVGVGFRRNDECWLVCQWIYKLKYSIEETSLWLE